MKPQPSDELDDADVEILLSAIQIPAAGRFIESTLRLPGCAQRRYSSFWRRDRGPFLCLCPDGTY
jgi:hypothetical protein